LRYTGRENTKALPRETGGAAAVWKGRTTMPDITAVTHAQNIRYDRKAEALYIIDQTLLPGEEKEIRLQTIDEMVEAIRALRVRGAPAIGICAAYCMYVLAKSIRTEDRPTFLKRLSDYGQQLDAARPTAVNLGWAIREMMRTALEHVHDTRGQMLDALYERAVAIHEDDIAKCRAISEYGLSLLKEGDGVLTHCNAGPLATSRYGTAQGPFLLAAERRGVPIFEYTPSQVKQAVVGYGKAEKRQVMDMTRRLLNLSAVPKPDDAADAVAIALCPARSFPSRLQSPDAARPGSGRYEVRKQVR